MASANANGANDSRPVFFFDIDNCVSPANYESEYLKFIVHQTDREISVALFERCDWATIASTIPNRVPSPRTNDGLTLARSM